VHIFDGNLQWARFVQTALLFDILYTNELLIEKGLYTDPVLEYSCSQKEAGDDRHSVIPDKILFRKNLRHSFIKIMSYSNGKPQETIEVNCKRNYQ